MAALDPREVRGRASPDYERGPVVAAGDFAGARRERGIDVVFPVLHGTFGEDGTVQGLLEMAGLPYVGAGVLASSVSMDKEVTKRLCAARPVCRWCEYAVLTRDEIGDAERVCGSLPFPVFVKPANLGSSVGISKAHNCEELRRGAEAGRAVRRKILVERGIIGREFECAVLGNENPEAAIPCEILPSRDFYDYEDKYLLDKAGTVLPAPLSPEQTAEMRRAGRGVLSRGELRRHGPRGFSDGSGHRPALH